MKINANMLANFLHQEFKHIGKKKTLGSFTIEELDELADHLTEVIFNVENNDDEPPF